jgi:uncharacterized protein DUF4491
MQINSLGLIAALTAFFSIWLGHVSVRKIEFISHTIWLPTLLFASAGLALEYGSMLTASRALAVVSGIAGITLLWDALEFTRQQRRVRKGHAPANPRNPRHAIILAASPHASTLDLLKREPLGRAVSADEAIQLIHKP